MIRSISRTTLLLLWLSCRSLSIEVHQSPSSILESPDVSATISCNHSVSTYNVILWYQQPKGSSDLKLIGFILYTNPTLEDQFNQNFKVIGDGSAKSQLQVLKLRQPEDSGVYYCAASRSGGAGTEAHFGGGTKLTVLEKDREITRPIVKVLQPSEKECKNSRGTAEKTIVCVATRFYPDHVSVSWQVGGEDVSTGVATDNNAQWEDKDKYYTITSRLRVSAKEWYNPNTEFKCTVSFYNGTETTLHSDEIYGDKAKEGVLTREKYLKITQTAKLSYGVFIVKSMVYGVFVAFLVWKLQNSSGKRNH